EDAAKLVDLEDQRVAVAVLVLAGHELDAVRGTDRGTEPARHAFGLAVFGREHAVRASPARRDRILLLRILDRHLLRHRPEQVPQVQRQALERGAHVARLRDRPLQPLYADGHQSPPPSAEPAPTAARASE